MSKQQPQKACDLERVGFACARLVCEEVGGCQPGAHDAHPPRGVIYDENISFDHYFGTYPRAANGRGEVPFYASPGTPTVNGLSGVLLSRNPNSTNPFRLDRANAVTCDMDHAYSAEQKAYHGGLVN